MIKTAFKVAVFAAFTSGFSSAVLAGGATTPSAPPPSTSGGAGSATSPANMPPNLVVVVTPVSSPVGGQQFQVSVNGQVVGTFTSAAVAGFIAAYY
jgi:hypothetical protein